MNRKRLAIALVTFVIWVALTLVLGHIKSGGQAPLADAVTKGLAWPILAAGLFVFAVCLWQGWRDVGLSRAPRLRDFLLGWLPLIYIVSAMGYVLIAAPPAPSLILWVLFNCLLVGFSEELMFRGALLQAFRHNVSIWPAVILTSVMFGAVHSLNVFNTGDLTSALIQSCAAFLSGIIFIALRLRTGSLWPSIILHGLWDAATFLLGTSAAGAGLDQAADTQGLAVRLLPILFVTPNALLGLYLMRNISRDNASPEN